MNDVIWLYRITYSPPIQVSYNATTGRIDPLNI